jgi:hypothetical protein
MRQTTKTCDRCQVEIAAGGTVFQAMAGELLDRFREVVDLCPACGTALVQFLEDGHHAKQDARGAVTRTPADRTDVPATRRV